MENKVNYEKKDDMQFSNMLMKLVISNISSPIFDYFFP